MKTLSFFLVLIFAIATSKAIQPPVRIERAFGDRATYSGVIIVYPGFAVHFVKKLEKQGPRPFWTYYIFDVLDRNTAQRIGSFTFVMGGIYVQPGFTVNGRRYGVEMFSTTSRDSRRLKEDDIIVWDERTARNSNPELYDWIWVKHMGKPNQSPEPTPTSGVAQH